MKEQIDKLDSNQNLKYLLLKDTIKRMTRQATEWKKIFVKHISIEGLT